MSEPTNYPLTWPAGRPRRPAADRKDSPFGTTKENRAGWREKVSLPVSAAVDRVLAELRIFGARYILISTDVELRKDGIPRSNRPEPADPGAAVYFTKDGRPYCLACDTFRRVADNLAAIAGHVEATRRQLRYGVATAEESLRAFQALPPPSAERPWRDVLELRDVEPRELTDAAVDQAFRRLARERHPDRGGSDAMMAELNVARARAVAEIRGGR